MHNLNRLRIGRFELRPAQRLLLHDGQPCRLGGRAFDVLMLLLENRDRVVTRAELVERVWPGLAVEPNNLQVQIWTLRKLLGKKSIVTVPRRGYRYVGPFTHAAVLRTPRWCADTRTLSGEVATPHTPIGQSLRARLRWNSRDD